MTALLLKPGRAVPVSTQRKTSRARRGRFQGHGDRLSARHPPGQGATFDRAGQYVWHCHVLEHEDNEMMRPYRVGPP
ncbi:multicopper oxidase domain-containing protein [Streptomyces sp. NPDC056653]|uniref:multicopper oxidase domain-containing protein n=1 Tax=Streptomyces sp. NPDC056653 TaxID=3345894 RepID=UPI00369A7AFA